MCYELTKLLIDTAGRARSARSGVAAIGLETFETVPSALTMGGCMKQRMKS